MSIIRLMMINALRSRACLSVGARQDAAEQHVDGNVKQHVLEIVGHRSCVVHVSQRGSRAVRRWVHALLRNALMMAAMH